MKERQGVQFDRELILKQTSNVNDYVRTSSDSPARTIHLSTAIQRIQELTKENEDLETRLADYTQLLGDEVKKVK
jgi:hypothetical protein